MCLTLICLYMLVSVLVHAFCYQMAFWVPYLPREAQPMGFAPLQPFKAYPWQVYVLPSDDYQPTPWMHQVAGPFTALNIGQPYATQLSSSHSSGIQLLDLVESHLIPLPSLNDRGLLFQVSFHQMTQSTLNPWWASGLVILVWCLSIRVVGLLTPGPQNSLLLIHTFTLGSWVRSHHPPSTWTWVGGVFISRPSSCRIQTGFGFYPYWFDQYWTHPLLNLMLLLFQALQGSYAQLILFLILLNHGLFLASNLINYGARLGHLFHRCLWPQRCPYPIWFSIFLATQQHLGSGLQHYQITLPWILSIGRLIRVFLNFRLALVSLLMLLSIQSSSFLTPALHLLVQFPLFKILRDEWFLFHKYMNYLPWFMKFWTMPCPNRLGTQLLS